MTSKPLIVVLLASHNGDRFLDEQLTSILEQREVRVRIVISDDASTDATQPLLDRVSERFENVELLAPGTFGSSQANFYRLIADADVTGADAIAFSDQDDVWMPTKLARHSALLERFDAISSNVSALHLDHSRTLIKKDWPQRRFDYIFESPGPGSTFLLRPHVFEFVRSVLASDARAHRINFHDWLVYALARAAGFAWHIDGEPTVDYRQHDDNAMGANTGVRPAFDRLARIRTHWHRAQAGYLAALGADHGDEAHASELHRLNTLIRARTSTANREIANLGGSLRRRPRDAAILSTMIRLGIW